MMSVSARLERIVIIPHLNMTFGGAAFAMDSRAFTFIKTCDLMVNDAYQPCC